MNFLNKYFFYIFVISTSFAFTFSEETYEDEDSDEKLEFVYKGDMKFLKTNGRMAAASPHKENWPDGVIPYIIDGKLPAEHVTTVNNAIAHFHQYTCLEFRNKVSTDTYNLRFIYAPSDQADISCSSQVGWQKRKNQDIDIGPTCDFGSMVHEIGHAIGFEHEHSRNDRDKYIIINNTNAEDLTDWTLDKDDTSCRGCQFEDFGVNYNYDSIMHYCDRCGAKNTKYPVFTQNPNAGKEARKPLGKFSNCGQTQGLSYGDYVMINKKYKCDTSGSAPPPPIADTAPKRNTSHSRPMNKPDVAGEKPYYCYIIPFYSDCLKYLSEEQANSFKKFIQTLYGD